MEAPVTIDVRHNAVWPTCSLAQRILTASIIGTPSCLPQVVPSRLKDPLQMIGLAIEMEV